MNEEDNNKMKVEEDEQNQKENYLIALKTEKTIAIIQLFNGAAKLLGTMDISEKFIMKKNICFHSFVYRNILETHQLLDNINQLQTKSTNSSLRSTMYQNADQQVPVPLHNFPDSADIFVCFSNGYILVMNSLSSQFLYNFNFSSEKADQIWHQRSITKIYTMPDQQSFLVLFADSTIIQYGLNSKKENHEFQADITKLEAQISFQQKKFGSSIQRKSYGSFEYSSISDKDFVGFACYYNDEDQFCGPHKYFKFKCPSISDFAILPYSHPLYRLVDGKYSREPLLIAYSGLDGLFRVLDIINFQAVYCFKSYYGGINSFSFENESSPLVSLACQDDSAIILNTRLNTYVRIVGHCSFVSYSIFTPITQNIIRITAGSYDGSISITELLRHKLDNQEKEDVNTEAYLPIHVKFQTQHAETVQIHHTQKMNDEGVAFVLGFKDYFLTSAFDGCASLFKYHTKIPESMQQSQSIDNEPPSEASQQEQQQYSQTQQKYQNQRKDSGNQNQNKHRQDEDEGNSKSGSKQQNQQNNNSMENEDDEDRGDQYRQQNKKSHNNSNNKQNDYQNQQMQNNSPQYQKREKQNDYNN